MLVPSPTGPSIRQGRACVGRRRCRISDRVPARHRAEHFGRHRAASGEVLPLPRQRIPIRRSSTNPSISTHSRTCSRVSRRGAPDRMHSLHDRKPSRVSTASDDDRTDAELYRLMRDQADPETTACSSWTRPGTIWAPVRSSTSLSAPLLPPRPRGSNAQLAQMGIRSEPPDHGTPPVGAGRRVQVRRQRSGGIMLRTGVNLGLGKIGVSPLHNCFVRFQNGEISIAAYDLEPRPSATVEVSKDSPSRGPVLFRSHRSAKVVRLKPHHSILSDSV